MTDRGDGSPLGAGPAREESGADDPLLRRAQSRLGTILHDKWHLDVLLGVGGMAAVYAATHRNGSRAAVKVLHPEMSTNPVVRERFLWEGYVANAVGHEGAVKVIDDDADEEGSLFLVTELLDGETLEERRIRLGGRLPPGEVLTLADQLLDVLRSAHANGIVHRDLKPENVFLTRAGQLKILDFGIARLRELSTARSLTQSGTMIGTPAYMAPEHARGLSNEVDERSDLWSCGAVMFCLISGRNVHEGRTVNEQIVNAITRAAPPLATVAPEIDGAICHVVDRALEFSKEMRWADAAAMQEAVRLAYHSAFGRSIAHAPVLTLGDGVPDRTLPQGSEGVSLRVPTTGRPVASSYWPAPLQAWPVGKRWIAIGGAVAFGFAATSFIWVVARGHRERPPEAAALSFPAAAAPPPPPSVILVVPSGPPEVSVSDLPVANASKPGRSTAGSSSSGGSSSGKKGGDSPSAASSSKPACDPPYTVDSESGKRHWKVECL